MIYEFTYGDAFTVEETAIRNEYLRDVAALFVERINDTDLGTPTPTLECIGTIYEALKKTLIEAVLMWRILTQERKMKAGHVPDPTALIAAGLSRWITLEKRDPDLALIVSIAAMFLVRDVGDVTR